MFMYDPLREEDVIIGYSSLLPLTKDGIEGYLNKSYKDSDIPVSMVTAPSQKAAAVLLFAIMLKSEYSFSKTGASRNYVPYFWNCLRKHALTLYSEMGVDGHYPPIYAQTEQASLTRRLECIGFTHTKKYTRDGFELLVLANPFQGADLRSQQTQQRQPLFKRLFERLRRQTI